MMSARGRPRPGVNHGGAFHEMRRPRPFEAPPFNPSTAVSGACFFALVLSAECLQLFAASPAANRSKPRRSGRLAGCFLHQEMALRLLFQYGRGRKLAPPKNFCCIRRAKLSVIQRCGVRRSRPGSDNGSPRELARARPRASAEHALLCIRRLSPIARARPATFVIRRMVIGWASLSTRPRRKAARSCARPKSPPQIFRLPSAGFPAW